MNQTLRGVPVFPLSGFYLFPGTVAPLHIFETRYRQMMKDLMDSSGRLVMAPCAPTAEQAVLGQAGPALPEVGTLAEIVRTEELEDGRWLILLAALTRVSLTEVTSDRLYRKVDAQVLADPEPESDAVPMLRTRLVAALRARSDGNWEEMPADAPVGQLADLLLHTLRPDPELCGRCYNERDPIVRATLALAWHTWNETLGDDDETAAD